MFSSRLLLHEFVTHDVRRFILERPDGYDFTPGQAAELAMDAPEWREEGRPFTFTSRRRDEVLEFTIKCYAEDGVTEALHRLEPGAKLWLGKPFGSIVWQGPGSFIAAGAGITPFLAIFRQLEQEGELQGNRVFISNKRPEDNIAELELRHYFGENCHFTYTRDEKGQRGQHIDRDYLASQVVNNPNQKFYLCGPPAMVEQLRADLQALGVGEDKLVFEH